MPPFFLYLAFMCIQSDFNSGALLQEKLNGKALGKLIFTENDSIKSGKLVAN